MPPGAAPQATSNGSRDGQRATAAADPLRHAIRLDALEQQLRPSLPPALAALTAAFFPDITTTDGAWIALVLGAVLVSGLVLIA